ncbi:hypothetical protein CFP56_006952 [Quercus suber]|uniref:Uncharacterized protein n=1 Tax=Quercus suber TaxID=58331 RepID=A0AAW0KCY4_QUESU
MLKYSLIQSQGVGEERL